MCNLVKHSMMYPNKTQSPDKASLVQNEKKLPQIPNASNVSEMLTSLQKMRTEKQGLLQAKQSLLTKQQDLQSKLAKELDQTQMEINELKSEIPSIQDKCRQIGQMLELDIYK